MPQLGIERTVDSLLRDTLLVSRVRYRSQQDALQSFSVGKCEVTVSQPPRVPYNLTTRQGTGKFVPRSRKINKKKEIKKFMPKDMICAWMSEIF